MAAMWSYHVVLSYFSLISLLLNIAGFVIGHLVWRKCVKKMPVARQNVIDAIEFGVIAALVYTVVTYACYLVALSYVPQTFESHVMQTITAIEVVSALFTCALAIVYFRCQGDTSIVTKAS